MPLASTSAIHCWTISSDQVEPVPSICAYVVAWAGPAPSRALARHSSTAVSRRRRVTTGPSRGGGGGGGGGGPRRVLRGSGAARGAAAASPRPGEEAGDGEQHEHEEQQRGGRREGTLDGHRLAAADVGVDEQRQRVHDTAGRALHEEGGR